MRTGLSTVQAKIEAGRFGTADELQRLGAARRSGVRTTPGPATGMGGQLFGRQAGVFYGPFQINGP